MGKNWEIGKLLKWSFAAVGKKDIVETWSFGADSDNKGIFFFQRSHIHWYLGPFPFPVLLFLAFLFCYLPPFPFLFCCLQPLSLISWAQVHPKRSQQDMHSNLIASTLICRLFLFCFAVCHLFFCFAVCHLFCFVISAFSVLLFSAFCYLPPFSFLFCYFWQQHFHFLASHLFSFPTPLPINILMRRRIFNWWESLL